MIKNIIFLLLFTSITSCLFGMEAPPKSSISFSMSSSQLKKTLKNYPHLVDIRNDQGKTLLVQAIEAQDIPKVNLLVRLHANPWIKDKNGECAMHAIGKVGNLAIARKVIKDHKKDTEWKEINSIGVGQTPYLYAKNNNHSACATFLCNFDRSENSLFQALMFGDTQKVDVLINDEAAANQVISMGDVKSLPLSWAIHLEDECLVVQLLAKGAKTYMKESIGISPWQWAENSPRIKALLQAHDDTMELHDNFYKAIINGDHANIEFILKKHSKKLFSVKFDRNPIALAIQAKKITSVCALSGKIPINCTIDCPGACEPPLFIALISGDTSIIEYLASRNPASLKLSEKYWPLNYPISEETKKLFFSLFSKYVSGFDESIAQEYLANATRHQRVALIEQAFRLGAHVDRYCREGLTAIHWACVRGNPEVLEYLLSKGANPNILHEKKKRSCFRLALRMHESSPKKEGKQITTSALLSCYFLLMCNGANPWLKDVYNEDIFSWLKHQNLHEDVKNVIRETLYLNDASHKDDVKEHRKKVLMKISELQKIELIMASANKDVEKVEQIKASLVEEDNKWRKMVGHEYKDIYEKYLK